MLWECHVGAPGLNDRLDRFLREGGGMSPDAAARSFVRPAGIVPKVS